MTDPLAILIDRATALVASVQYDDSGHAGKGGNGGLLSRETIRNADELRLALNGMKRPRASEEHG